MRQKFLTVPRSIPAGNSFENLWETFSPSFLKIFFTVSPEVSKFHKNIPLLYRKLTFPENFAIRW